MTAGSAGQLAGAVYSVSGIPAERVTKLVQRKRLQTTAASLFDVGWPEQPEKEAAS